MMALRFFVEIVSKAIWQTAACYPSALRVNVRRKYGHEPHREPPGRAHCTLNKSCATSGLGLSNGVTVAGFGGSVRAFETLVGTAPAR